MRGSGVTAADDALKQAAEAFRTQRDSLVQVGVEPPPERGDLASDWPALAAWAADETPVRDAAAKQADARAEEVQRARDRQLGALVTRARELEVDVGTKATTDDLARSGRCRRSTRRRRSRSGSGRASWSGRRLETEIETHRGRRSSVARELARLLDAAELRALARGGGARAPVDGASARLARALRPASTRSRSRSAAATSWWSTTAMPTSAARCARCREARRSRRRSRSRWRSRTSSPTWRPTVRPRLESIFLDEGFGSLDPDTLETVAGHDREPRRGRPHGRDRHPRTRAGRPHAGAVPGDERSADRHRRTGQSVSDGPSAPEAPTPGRPAA